MIISDKTASRKPRGGFVVHTVRVGLAEYAVIARRARDDHACFSVECVLIPKKICFN